MTQLTRTELIADFLRKGNPRDKWRVGAEFERHVLALKSGAPIPYRDALEPALERIAAMPGSLATREDGRIIAIAAPWGALTLEPGGQVELSGRPHASLAAVRDEAVLFHDIVQQVTGDQWVQLGLGYTPFASLEAIEWVPKGRYGIMRDHLSKTGALAHNMMKGTCATQASFDYFDEEDCARKVSLAAAIAPVVLALTANSPYTEGRANGFMSVRGHIWLDTDPARTGLPDAAQQFSFERWVDYLLDVPLLFRRDAQGEWLSGGADETFRGWLEDPSHPPDRSDWTLHQTSIFPEVRVKGQIEVRSPDATPLPHAMAAVALYTAVLYDPESLREAVDWVKHWWQPSARRSALESAARHGLQGTLHGVPALELAGNLLNIARRGLHRLGETGEDWLAPLSDSVDSGRCPGRALLEVCGPEPRVDELLRCSAYLPEPPR